MSAPDWASLPAPGLAEFEAMAQAAYGRLPEPFRGMTRDLVIRVEDFATDEVLDRLGIDSEYDLLGLFQGVGLAQGGGTAEGFMPNMIFLYRRAILDYWAEHEESLGDIVTHVLVHEIGHHFGLSDADMAAIEARDG